MAKHILIVEDELSMQRALKNRLEQSGYAVATANDGEQAIAAIRASMPDLVLLDLIMPKLDGISVLREIKKDEKLSAVSVIILTNLSTGDKVAEAMQLGTFDFLVKIYTVKLKKEGYDVNIATDGEQAVKLAGEVKPDLILLDLILPKMNGFEALEQIRATATGKNIPVIVLSNLGQEEDIKRAELLGATDYLVKANFSIQEVIAKMAEVLSRS
jgi:DNA-binding response OmpR family regulator